MPASTIVASGGEFRLYGDSVQTFADLPVATYTISFSQVTGYSLRQTEPLASAEETVYGSHASRVQRIVTGYSAMDRSLGVILSGDKGMGKSLMLRLLTELQTINNWDTGTGLQFRMRDAVPSEDGYLLPDGAFTLTDLRDEDDRSPDDEKDLRAAAVTLRRPPKYSIDF